MASCWGAPPTRSRALLGSVDRLIYGVATDDADPFQVVERMRPFIATHLAAGGRLSAFTRHMLGLYHKVPGARAWRRILTEEASGRAQASRSSMRRSMHS